MLSSVWQNNIKWLYIVLATIVTALELKILWSVKCFMYDHLNSKTFYQTQWDTTAISTNQFRARDTSALLSPGLQLKHMYAVTDHFVFPRSEVLVQYTQLLCAKGTSKNAGSRRNVPRLSGHAPHRVQRWQFQVPPSITTCLLDLHSDQELLGVGPY